MTDDDDELERARRWKEMRHLWPEQPRGEEPKPLDGFRRRAAASAEAGWAIIGWALDLAVVVILTLLPWALLAGAVAGVILAARWWLS